MSRSRKDLQACLASARSMHGTPLRVTPRTQTEELLVKRRNLLEKKIEQETERAKEFTRTKNKRGAVRAPPCLQLRMMITVAAVLQAFG